MLTMEENVIVAGDDNRIPMLDTTQYSSWASRMLFYIKGKEHGKLLYESVINELFKYGTITVPGTPTTPATVRDRTYDELTYAKKIHEACDIKATNIVLQGLPQYIYNLVNHHSEAKDIWDRVKLLIKGSKISLQERESKLYDEFDTFTSVPGETIHSYYLRPRILGNSHSSYFHSNDLDAFESDCDEAPSASAVLMAKLSAYDSDVLSEVPTHETYLDNQVIDQSVQEMQYSEQPIFNNDTDIDITSKSNIISYEQYLKETENAVVQDTSSSAQQDALKMSVIEKMSNQVAKCNEVDKVNKTVNESLTAELERYKDQIKIFKERQKFDLNDREKYIDS
ncbi:hypothetical protein Tco_0520952 [Tanacetum coccineum]